MYKYLARSADVEEFFESVRLLTVLQLFFLNCGVQTMLTWLAVDATCTGLVSEATRLCWATSMFKVELTMLTNSSEGERCKSENPFKHRRIVQTDKKFVV